MKNSAGSEMFLRWADGLPVALGLLTGRYVVTGPTADTPDGGQLGDDEGGQAGGSHSTRTTGRTAPAEPLERVEVDGTWWVNLGQGEPLTARKCVDPECSVCGHLPGPQGTMWVALLGPLAALAHQPGPEAPTGPETAAESPFRPPVPAGDWEAVRLLALSAGGLLPRGLCDCPRCELGRAQRSVRPDTPGD